MDFFGHIIGNSAQAQGGYTFQIVPPSRYRDLITLAEAVAGYAFRIAIPIAVAVVVYAGIKFLLARGNASQIQDAKRILLWAVVGVAVLAIGSGFIALINDILGI